MIKKLALVLILGGLAYFSWQHQDDLLAILDPKHKELGQPVGEIEKVEQQPSGVSQGEVEKLKVELSQLECSVLSAKILKSDYEKKGGDYFRLLVDLMNLTDGSLRDLACETSLAKRGLKVLSDEKLDVEESTVAEFVQVSVRSLSQSGYFDTLSNFDSLIYGLFENNRGVYQSNGWKIERQLCYSLKNVGKKAQCKHLFKPPSSKQSELFYEIEKKSFNDEWQGLLPLLDQVEETSMVDGWRSYYLEARGKHDYHSEQYEFAIDLFKTAISAIPKGDLVPDNLDSYLYAIRTYRRMKLYGNALKEIDSALEKLKSQLKGPCFVGMALSMQKALIYQKTRTPYLKKEAQQSFKDSLGEDPFSKHYAEAFNQVLANGSSYQPPFQHIDFDDVKEALKR